MPNDFNANPAGNSPRPGGVDFTRNPGGNSTAEKAQSTGEAYDINPTETPAGGKTLFADAIPSAEKDLGVGTIGNGQKPFKLDGGG